MGHNFIVTKASKAIKYHPNRRALLSSVYNLHIISIQIRPSMNICFDCHVTFNFPGCVIASMGTTNIRSVWTWPRTNLPSSVPVRGRTLGHWFIYKNPGLYLLERQNWFVGLLQKGKWLLLFLIAWQHSMNVLSL